MRRRTSVGCIFSILVLFANVWTQTTEISYQGQLQSSASPANGNFDFEFALFDSAGGGTQLGATIPLNGVVVTNGIFSVRLDFGNQFPGPNRFLEIRVRTAGGGSFSTLSPRQSVNSAPYSIRSLNASTADNANTATTAANLSNPLGGDVTGAQSNTTVARLQGRNVASTPPNNGQVLKFNTTNSRWEPANDETATSGGGGTITGVTAGTGLTGGGTTGSVTVAIANAGVGTPQIADASVTDAKIVGVSGAKVIGAVTNATNALNATTAANSSNLGGVPAIQFLQVTGNGSGLTNLNASNIATGTLDNSRLGVIPLANGGTGSAIQNFVDLSTNQTIFGNKTFSRLFTTGNVGIGTNTPTYRLDVLHAGGLVGLGIRSRSSSDFSVVDIDAANGDAALRLQGAGELKWIIRNDPQTDNLQVTQFGAGERMRIEQATGDLIVSTTLAGNVVNSATQYNINGIRVFSNQGVSNIFVGAGAGDASTTGSGNSFFGAGAGNAFTTGQNNTALGRNSDVGAGNLVNATAIGANAQADQSNSLVLGSVNGVNFANSDTSVGIGTTTPSRKLHLSGSGSLASGVGDLLVTGTGTFGSAATLEATGSGGRTYSWLSTSSGASAGAGKLTLLDITGNAFRMVVDSTGNVGIGTNSPNDKLDVNGTIGVATLGAAGATTLCRNASNQISTCSSSLRYKTNIAGFTPGLSFVNKLRPISYDWKDGGMHDIGFGAEDVARIDPRFVTYNDKGDVEGVKYDRLSVAFVNAFKEQQQQIAVQNNTILRQQSEIDALRSLVCAKRRKTGVCKQAK